MRGKSEDVGGCRSILRIKGFGCQFINKNLLQQIHLGLQPRETVVCCRASGLNFGA
ncbi:hypothetical protein Scep_004250 [Stephania cephalantha]|uniref:Uncharacterized protein n=1 Tax=Stephania cephalantha TaxID=152367 RepID=A0AAP0PYW7_9MAGN